MDYEAAVDEGWQFDKIASVGMMEHLGKEHMSDFTKAVQKLLKPGGLALLHLITTPEEGR
jgi:cyclopropane-fatty-acyl-phospholipid synthase